MTRLPQRPRQHVLETESRKFVANIFPSEWIINDINNDYGIDLDIEIVEGTDVTGAHFSMQLKSTDSLKITKNGFISHSCKTSTLRYFLEKTEPIIFFIYDSINRSGYWIWVQEYIRNELAKNKKWKKKTTNTIRIPRRNVFTENSLNQIKARVMRLHQKAKLFNIIQTLDNPYIRYGLEFDENKEVITMSPKYPGAEQDYPLALEINFNFDKSYEAQRIHQTLQDALKKGLPASINAKFINNLKFPELIDPEIFGYDEFKPDELLIVPISQNRNFPAVITILDHSEKTLARIPLVEFREKYYGSEEITFSNEHTKSPMIFTIKLNLVEHTASISFHFSYQNVNAFQTLEAMKIQKALAEGTWLLVSHALTDTVLMKPPIPENFISPPLPILFEVASNLSFIQEKTGQTIPWPQKISYAEKDLIEEIVSIINTGQSNGGSYIEFGLEKSFAQKLLAPFDKDIRQGFRFEAKERYANLFGQKIILGPVSIMALSAQPSSETKTRITTNGLPDDAVVQIELEVDDPGVMYYHHNWISAQKMNDLNQKYRI